MPPGFTFTDGQTFRFRFLSFRADAAGELRVYDYHLGSTGVENPTLSPPMKRPHDGGKALTRPPRAWLGVRQSTDLPPA